LLDRSLPDLDEATAALKEIVADGHRAGAVIESIRAIFKMDARSRTSLDINDIIREALVLVSGNLNKHRILVQTETNAQPPQVTGDRIQLRQVLVNLMANAIDSMAGEDGPRVLCVKSELQDGSIMVSVADTGAGIGPQDVGRIFNPLFTTKSDGMGIGLSICRSVIEAHHGQLWVAGNAPRGAVFQFVPLRGIVWVILASFLRLRSLDQLRRVSDFVPVSVGNLIRLASEAESRNASAL
jgi:C4-dicarboxylate-specific signal transduction histidine kinase